MRVVTSTLLSLALLLLVFPGSSVASDHATFPDRAYQDSWAAPLDLEGDLTIRFRVDFGEENHCTSFVGAGSSDPEGGVFYRMSGAHFGITSWSGRPAHVQHDEVDTRTVVSLGGGTGVRMTSAGPLSGVHDVTMTVFSASALRTDTDDPWLPLEWALGCDAPFEISGLQGGREALGFTHLHLEGGTGASADGFLVAASLNQGTGVSATFTSPEVTFDWFSYDNVQGVLTLDHGGAAVDWDLTQTTRGSYAGGPGEYAIMLDRIGAGMFDDVVGVIVGTGPVGSFDELV
jgi:hypothetical protein